MKIKQPQMKTNIYDDLTPVDFFLIKECPKFLYPVFQPQTAKWLKEEKITS